MQTNITQLSLESLLKKNNWKLFFVSAISCLYEWISLKNKKQVKGVDLKEIKHRKKLSKPSLYVSTHQRINSSNYPSTKY